MTLSTLFEEYLKEYLLEVKATSHHTWKSHARVLLAELGDVELSSIRERDIRFWVSQCRGRLKPASINHRLSFLRQALDWAKREGYLETNPAQGVAGPSVLNARYRTLSVQEEAALQEAMHPRTFSVVRFLVLTGLRRLELFRIREEHVDWDRKHLLIPESKTDMQRIIPLHPEAMLILLKWRETATPGAYLFFPEVNPGNRMEAGNAWYARSFKPMLARVGIRDLKIHDLRHTFASRLVELGIPLYTVQQLLGHRDPKQTQRYAHLSAEHLRQAVYRLN